MDAQMTHGDKNLEIFTCFLTYHSAENFKACIVRLPTLKEDFDNAKYHRWFVTSGRAVMVICYEGQPTTEFIRAILQNWKAGQWQGINSKGHVIPDRVKRAYGFTPSPKPQAPKKRKK